MGLFFQKINSTILFVAFFISLSLLVINAKATVTFKVTNTNNAGTGSLRQAILNAQSNGDAGPKVIDASAMPSGSVITLQSALPVIYFDAVFNGPANGDITLTKDPALIFRHLYNADGNSMTINNFKFQGGKAEGIGEERNGGAILNKGFLRVNYCVFLFNNSSNDGGAIHNATDYSTLIISNTYFWENEAEYGGAVNNKVGDMTVTNCTFHRNGKNLTDGGAVYTSSPYLNQITNTTFSGNESELGGAIFIGNAVSLTLTNATITNNSASNTNTLPSYGGGGGIHVRTAGNVILNQCIVAGNTAFLGQNDIDNTTQPAANVTSNTGHNIIGNTTGSNLTGVIIGNVLNIPAASVFNTTLQQNNGFVPSHLPVIGGPAVNGGILDPTTSINDGRGFARVGLPDIGAIEISTVDSKIPATISILPTVALPICEGQPVPFQATVSNQGSNPVFQWKVNSSFITLPNSASVIINGLKNGDTIRCILTSSAIPDIKSIPVVSSEIIIQLNPIPPIPASNPLIVYCINSPSLPLVVSGLPGATFNWFLDSLKTLPIVTPKPSTSINDTLFFYVSQTVLGCEGVLQQIEVQINAEPTAPITTFVINYCLNDVSAILSATGANLRWYKGTVLLTQAPTPKTDSSGLFTYFVSQVVNGCESPKSKIEVNVSSVLAPVAIDSIGYCQFSPGVIALKPNGNGYNWYTTGSGGNRTDSIIPQVSNPGKTIFYVSFSNNGCESPRSAVAVTIIPLSPNPSVNDLTTYCLNDETYQLAAVGQNLLWYNDSGELLSEAPTPSSAIAGTTIWYVTQNTGICKSRKVPVTVTVFDIPLVKIIASGPVKFCISDSVTLSSNETSGNRWIRGNQQTESIVVYESGFYILERTDPITGCKANDTIFVSAIPCEAQIFIPDAFSPNNDGQNDILNIKTLEVSKYTFQVFNRWGKMIFQSNAQSEGWNGTTNGTESPEGVYVYKVQFEGYGRPNVFVKTGTIVLLR